MAIAWQKEYPFQQILFIVCIQQAHQRGLLTYTNKQYCVSGFWLKLFKIRVSFILYLLFIYLFAYFKICLEEYILQDGKASNRDFTQSNKSKTINH